MKLRRLRWTLLPLAAVATVGLLLSSCSIGSSSSQSEFYDAGNASVSLTGAQFDQFALVAFDTSSSALTLALPSASDIVANLSSPYVGEVIYFAVAAEGVNGVTLIPGTNVVLGNSALKIPANT